MIDPATRDRLSGAFDSAAGSYAAARPGYPDAAVDWLLDGSAGDVLDLGAGSGALTRQLAVSGLRHVVAAEPSANLLRELGSALPVRDAAPTYAVQAGAESLPFADASFDVVTVATAFHWFDAGRALPELARVLRGAGHLSLVWNSRSLTEPWTHRFEHLLRSAQPASLTGDWGAGSARALEGCAWFEAPAYAEFPHAQRLDRAGLTGLVASRSYVIALDAPRRSALLGAVGALFDGAAAGAATLGLPYVSRCWRSPVRP